MTESCGNVQALERRDALRRWGRRAGYLVLCLSLLVGSMRLYDGWRRKHLTRQTAHAITRGDIPSAVLTARRLLQFDPDSLIACRAMAEMAEQNGRSEAVDWRRKVANLEPGVTANEIALARCALRFGQLDMTERVLDKLALGTPGGSDYHQLRGALALARQNRAEAETHFAAAVLAAPADPRMQLNLALLRLTSTDQKTKQQAHQTLVELIEKPQVRLESLRGLTAAALAQGDSKAAQDWARQLLEQADATFSDSLLVFQAAQGTPAAQSALAALQKKGAASAAQAAELITWMNRHEMARVAADWSATLPAEILATQPVPLAIAESFSFLQDWATLRKWVEGKDWGACESLRLAVESHALRRLSATNEWPMESQVVWRAAVKTAQERPEQLIAIAQLADGWGYQAQAEETWWIIANGSSNPRPALSALQRFYLQTQDTRGLWRVAKRALELNPDDLVAANNCASFGLLLSGDGTSRRLALKLHLEHPTNRAFAATYAYALQTEGRGPEGLQLLETLKEDELRYPTIAAYYVVMLVENGKLGRAREFLASAKRATLLPEEQVLLSAASAKLFASAAPELAKK